MHANIHIAQSNGGKASAIKNRAKAELAYYKSPRICVHCNNVIHPIPSMKVGYTKKKKFCSLTCSAIHRNKTIKRVVKVRNCAKCGERWTKKPNRAWCDVCWNTESCRLLEMTKIQAGGVRIRAHARSVFMKNPSACTICGYSRHVEVCHRKPVSSFPGHARIKEINDIGNLVGLCPTHHWEFDHDILNGQI